MMNIYKTTSFLTIFLFLSISALAQDKINNETPKVFLVGEQENEYADLIDQYSQSLIGISNDSIELAYINWMYLLYDMESYSHKIGFDLNGIKLWINVFWNKNGNIDYISYYPKPNSKNMEFNKLTAFLSEFIKNYKPRMKSNENFAHFGSAKFPSFAENYIPDK